MSEWQEGNYKGCKLVSAVTSEKGEKKTPTMVLDFDIQGHTKQVYLYLSEGAWPFSREKLEKLGFNGDFENPVFTAGDDVELFMRREEYEGKQQERWNISGGVIKADTSTLKQLSARFKASTGKPPTKPAGAPAPAPKAPTTPPTVKKAGPPPVVTPPAKAYDKTAAWDEFTELNKACPDINAAWEKAVLAVCGEGRTEDDFTSDDWGKVASFDIPFN